MTETSRLTGVCRPLAPLDYLTLLYTTGSFLILTVQAVGTRDLRLSKVELGLLLGAHVLLIILVLLAAEARRQAAGKPSFLAEWYPLVVLTAVYGSVGLVNAPREAAGLSYDAVVQGWEAATFGRQVAHEWSRDPNSTAVSWPLSLSYLAFFPVLIAAPALLWWRRRHECARQMIFGITLTFFTCYILFLLFPVAGPPYLWGWPLDPRHTRLPARMVQDLIDNADSWGSAFPSSHVAASMAAAMLGLRMWRPLGLMLLPMAVAICIGVVYFQVHYAIDALAGFGIAVVTTMMTRRVWTARAAAAT